MTAPRSPRQVFLELVHGVAANRWDDLPGLYAEQTDVRHPFDPLRAGPLSTRDELRQHFTPPAGAQPDLSRTAANIVIHETTDPEVIVAEFEYQGTTAETSETYSIPCIFVLRVRDGQIVESRDYIDHLGAARARGRLDELITAITATATATTTADARR